MSERPKRGRTLGPTTRGAKYALRGTPRTSSSSTSRQRAASAGSSSSQGETPRKKARLSGEESRSTSRTRASSQPPSKRSFSPLAALGLGQSKEKKLKKEHDREAASSQSATTETVEKPAVSDKKLPGYVRCTSAAGREVWVPALPATSVEESTPSKPVSPPPEEPSQSSDSSDSDSTSTKIPGMPEFKTKKEEIKWLKKELKKNNVKVDEQLSQPQSEGRDKIVEYLLTKAAAMDKRLKEITGVKATLPVQPPEPVKTKEEQEREEIRAKILVVSDDKIAAFRRQLRKRCPKMCETGLDNSVAALVRCNDAHKEAKADPNFSKDYLDTEDYKVCRTS